MEVLLSIINSPVFKALVVCPLAVVGFYQIFRGVSAIIEKDVSKHDWLNGWMLITYLAVTVLGCLCLVVVL